MEKMARKLKFNNMDIVPVNGNAGGLVSFWSNDLALYIDTKEKSTFSTVLLMNQWIQLSIHSNPRPTRSGR